MSIELLEDLGIAEDEACAPVPFGFARAYTSPSAVKIVGDRGKLEVGDVMPGSSCAVKVFFAFPVPLEEVEEENV